VEAFEAALIVPGAKCGFRGDGDGVVAEMKLPHYFETPLDLGKKKTKVALVWSHDGPMEGRRETI
jgi:hypothetical protein